jgi:hypothetical protein
MTLKERESLFGSAGGAGREGEGIVVRTIKGDREAGDFYAARNCSGTEESGLLSLAN